MNARQPQGSVLQWALGATCALLSSVILILVGVQNARLDRVEGTVQARGERIAVLETRNESFAAQVVTLTAKIEQLLALLQRHLEDEANGAGIPQKSQGG